MATPKEITIIRILEIAWLIIAIASIGFGVYETVTSGIGESYLFFIFTVVAGVMYGMRRRQREKLQKETDNE
ncbi:MAG: hypothetical protein COB85_03930 [Bacteroidetes bacterium]|nr:MAG: hypothetical protein COB85_03930 [Bacteroidota bacterium]